ncbi:hypothetical protein WDU94_002944 [Cyamophila willieti]
MASNSNRSGERFKVKVSGLPRFYSLKDPLLQDFLTMINSELRLNCVHARFTKKGNAWLYLSFETEESQLRALNALRRFTWLGRTLIATLVTANPVRGKHETPYFEEDFSRKSLLNVPAIEQVLMSTIPYHSISYEEQLKKKSEEVYGLFKRFHNILKSKLFPYNYNTCSYAHHTPHFYHQHINPEKALNLEKNSLKTPQGVRQDGRRDNRPPQKQYPNCPPDSTIRSYLNRSQESAVRSYQNRTRDCASIDSRTTLLASWYEKKLNDHRNTSGFGGTSNFGGMSSFGSTSAMVAAGDNEFPFKIEKVRASPIVDEYRNKVEFTVGINPDSNTLSVGPRIKSDTSGRVQVGPVEGLRHLPPHVVTCAKEFEVFVRNSFGSNNQQTNRHGTPRLQPIWKSIIIRTNNKKELMMIFIADIPEQQTHQNPTHVGIPTKKIKTGHEDIIKECNIAKQPPHGTNPYKTADEIRTSEVHTRKTNDLPTNIPKYSADKNDLVMDDLSEDIGILQERNSSKRSFTEESHETDDKDDSLIEEHKRQVIEYFTKEQTCRELNVVSMYFQLHKDRSALSFSRSDLIWGREYIIEKLLDLDIAIAAGTYFRINSMAAQVLSEAILQLSLVTMETTVLDLFCGSGSIALTLAKVRMSPPISRTT